MNHAAKERRHKKKEEEEEEEEEKSEARQHNVQIETHTTRAKGDYKSVYVICSVLYVV